MRNARDNRGVWLSVLLILLALMSSVDGSSASWSGAHQGERVPVYRKALQSALRSVKQAERSGGGTKAEWLRRALRLLKRIEPQANGPVRESLEAALHESEPRGQRKLIRQAAERLRAYLQVLQEAPKRSRAQQVQRQLAAIYADPSLRTSKSALERFLEWAGRQFESFFRWLSRLFPGTLPTRLSTWDRFYQWGMIALLVLLVALGSAYLLNKLEWRRWQRSSRQASGETAEPSRQLPPDEGWARAHSLAQQGRYREAIRFCYHATLALLAQRGLIPYDPARTNWEHLALLRAEGHKQVYERLRPLTRQFDYIWYGHQPATEEEYRQFDQTYLALKQSSLGTA